MKYGESVFDVAYLVFALVAGLILLSRKGKTAKLCGAAALTLGIGDAFHLVPRVLNYFVSADFTAALGAGKLITSITMTAFYVLLYYIFEYARGAKPRLYRIYAVFLFALIRVVLCAFPQNGWLTDSSPLVWGIARNVPFLFLGAYVAVLYFIERKDLSAMRHNWLLIALSFAFYIPVVVGASFVPMLGMLMLPKTVCYVLMLVSFLRTKQLEGEEK